MVIIINKNKTKVGFKGRVCLFLDRTMTKNLKFNGKKRVKANLIKDESFIKLI